MTEEKCSYHKDKRANRVRRCCRYSLVLLFILLLIFLITWAILQPKKPRFIILDATLYNFNVSSSPDLFTSNFQITVASRNPNDKIGVYYDDMEAYAWYRGQQITYYTGLPATYQGHKSSVVWSPFIAGDRIPVAPFNGVALRSDQATGYVKMMIMINGRVRWKVGAFVSGRYHLHVTCPAYIPCGNKYESNKYQLQLNCKVSV